MSCSACSREIKIIARGLCRACYQRWLKRGTTAYAPKRHRTFCQIDDCGKPVVSNGMCDMHRNRLRKHGHVEQTRPDSWGAKTGHPLYNAWSWMMRHRAAHPVSDGWMDFLQFVADVGERPSPKHKLFCADDAAPIGPENYVWKEAITQRVAGEDYKTYQNRVHKVYRAVRREAFAGYDLKKNYGLSADKYDALSAEQGDKCAICLLPETAIIRGKRLRLAVDHCHISGHVRALLCGACNKALGGFRDDPALLRSAAAYLEKHALPIAAN